MLGWLPHEPSNTNLRQLNESLQAWGGLPSSSLLPESQVSTPSSPRQEAVLGDGLQGIWDPSFCMQLIT